MYFAPSVEVIGLGNEPHERMLKGQNLVKDESVSEGNILEVYQGVDKGADLNVIRRAMELMESLNPLWIRITSLDLFVLLRVLPVKAHPVR